MRVLVTGAAGFVGRVTVELLATQHEVTPFDIRPADTDPPMVVGDVRDYEAVLKVMEGHDAVINTVRAPETEYGGGKEGFTINVTGMFNLLEAARTVGIRRFVHTSSGAVHTGYPRPPATFLHRDLYPLKASGPYALSKLLQEEMARSFHEQYGMSIAAIRPWGIIDAALMVNAEGSRVSGFYWGSIDRHDVASALQRALEAEEIGYECFYVMATPGGYRATDVDYTERRLGWKPTITFEEDL